MSAAVAPLAAPVPNGPPLRGAAGRDGLRWAAGFAVVLSAHLAVGLWLLRAPPETGPVEAVEPIAVIDLPPAPVLPDAVAATDLPPSDVPSIPPTQTRAIGGTTAPGLAEEAPEPIEAPVALREVVPADAAPLPPVPALRPPDVAEVGAPPPEAAAPLLAEAAPTVPPQETPQRAPADAIAAEPPLEAAPVVPDAAVALSGPVALPPRKPEVPAPPVARAAPPKTQARTPGTGKPVARTAQRKAVEKAAARKPAGPAAETPKAGARRTAAAPRAAGGGPVTDILKQYQAKVRADIEREVRRLSVSRRGVAAIRFSFSRSGALAGAAVARSSGDPAIDRAALTAVKRASPFPAAPAALPQQSFTLTVPIRMK